MIDMRFVWAAGFALAACSPLDNVGRLPELSSPSSTPDLVAMSSDGAVEEIRTSSSLWATGPRSLLGNHRAARRGDIVTVVVEVNDKAEISNSSARSRNGSESVSIPGFLGIPQRMNGSASSGSAGGDLISTNSTSSSTGDGSVRRKEKLTLRIAATVTDVLPNGVLHIEGSQEIRVNFEVRELLVAGFVRPEDISRKNEISYDKIAAARISYGGRGRISEVQQPRYGQQLVDTLSPF